MYYFHLIPCAYITSRCTASQRHMKPEYGTGFWLNQGLNHDCSEITTTKWQPGTIQRPISRCSASTMHSYNIGGSTPTKTLLRGLICSHVPSGLTVQQYIQVHDAHPRPWCVRRPRSVTRFWTWLPGSSHARGPGKSSGNI